MTWGERLFGWTPSGADAPSRASLGHNGGPAMPRVQAYSTYDLKGDVELSDFLRGGASGQVVNWRTVLRNPAVYRSVTLISNVIGMLPLQLMTIGDDGSEGEKAKTHPLYALLAHRPNHWQTAFVFRRLIQHRVLTRGDGYALPIMSRGKVSELIPLANDRMRVVQADDWSVDYIYTRKQGGEIRYRPNEILHVMGPSEDGLTGLPLVEVAGEAIGLALQAQRYAGRTFKGVTAGGALSTDKTLSPEAVARLKDSLEQDFSGEQNAGKWMVTEEGLKATPFASTARDAQNVENRKLQIEEIARIFGVPRPLLMVDDTSWGSGIEQLGKFFVEYGLAPHFVAWEQAIARTLLGPNDEGKVAAKFNERALLRGSIKDQGEFWAKALGSGGQPAWLTQNEVRRLSDMPPHPDGNKLSPGMGKGPTNAQ